MNCTCGGDLEQGFIPDFTAAIAWPTVWMSGAPDVSKGAWELLRTGGGVRLEREQLRVVEAWRCTSCGRLELFANRPPEQRERPVMGS